MNQRLGKSGNRFGAGAADGAPAAHASTHQSGGSDEIDVTDLAGLLAAPQTPASHASTHENGGGDEISVTGLSGALADPQTPTSHAAIHQDGGSDEIATATPAADAIPKALGSGALDAAWLPGATVGVVMSYNGIVVKNHTPSADTDAARGTALLAAIDEDPDTVIVPAGTYNIGANERTLLATKSIAILGAGMERTKIIGAKAASQDPVFTTDTIDNNRWAELQNLTIENTAGVSSVALELNRNGYRLINARLTCQGNAQGCLPQVQSAGARIRAFNCEFIATLGNGMQPKVDDGDYHNCLFKTTHASSLSHAIGSVQSGAGMKLYNCRLETTGSSLDAIDWGTGLLRMFDCVFDGSASQFEIDRNGGTVIVNNCYRDLNTPKIRTSGQVTIGTSGPFILGFGANLSGGSPDFAAANGGAGDAAVVSSGSESELTVPADCRLVGIAIRKANAMAATFNVRLNGSTIVSPSLSATEGFVSFANEEADEGDTLEVQQASGSAAGLSTYLIYCEAK